MLKEGAKFMRLKITVSLTILLFILVTCMTSAFASTFKSNILPGFLVDSGTWTESTNDGVCGTTSGNAFYMSVNNYSNFIFQSDVKVESTYGVATLVFRAGSSVYSSYGLSIDPNMDKIRFFRFSDGYTIASYTTTINTGTTYNLKIVAEGNIFNIYLNGNLIISNQTDSTFTSGRVGLNVYNGTAYFQNVNLYEFKTNVSGWSSISGTWSKSNEGMTGTYVNDNGFYMSSQTASNFLYTGDVKIESTYASAKLVFRAQSSEFSSYAVDIDPNMDRVRLFNFASGDIQVYNTQIDTGVTYKVKVIANGNNIKVYLNSVKVIDATATAYSSGRIGLSVYNGTAYFNNVNMYNLDSLSSIKLDAYDKILRNGDTNPLNVTGVIGTETFNLNGAASYSSSDTSKVTVNSEGVVTAQANTGSAVITATVGSKTSTLLINLTEFKESFRPQYHYSPRSAGLGDTRGVYYDGQYHLFHQGDAVWSHAVSTDLITWQQKPVAIEPDGPSGLDFGEQIWSGSVAVDTNNTSGFFPSSSGLVSTFTLKDKSNGLEQVCLAYSKDSGTTWTKYSGNPVIRNIDNTLMRDPKIFWHAASNKWVLLLACDDRVKFYSSTNLKDWDYMSEFGVGQGSHDAIWECPDLVELAVDGNASNKKWVLITSVGNNATLDGSRMQYFVGSFNGTSFTNDNSGSTVLWMDFFNDIYGSISFSNMTDGRTILISWMGNYKYPSGLPTYNNDSIPRKLELKDYSGTGVRLAQTPVSELDNLRTTTNTFSQQTITPGTNILSNITGNSIEIVAEFELSTATEFGFKVRKLGGRETKIGYNVSGSYMFIDRTNAGLTYWSNQITNSFTGQLSPVSNRIKMRIYVDNSTVEVFANDGRLVGSALVFPENTRDGLELYSVGGNVTLVSLNVYDMKSVWRTDATGTSPTEVVLDNTVFNILANGSITLYNQVLPRTATNKNVSWTSSNTSVATVTQIDNRSATINAGSTTGQTTITVTTQDGSKTITCIVNVCSSFPNTNISNWAVPDGERWNYTSEGRQGQSGSYDSFYMSSSTYTNFNYSADVQVDPSTPGASAVLVLRAQSGNDKSSYGVALDPFQGLIKLYTFTGGSIINAPVSISTGTWYNLKVTASGNNIKVYLDNVEVINVNDSAFSSGRLGLCDFGGKVYFKNVNATDL